MCPSILIFRLKIFYIKKRVEKACIFSFCKVRALKCGLLGDLQLRFVCLQPDTAILVLPFSMKKY